MEETIGVTQSEPTKNFPVWIKTAIDDRSSRFNAALASITHTDLIDPELVIEVKNTYPQVTQNTVGRVQSALGSETEVSNTLTALERLEYLTTLVELSAGINSEGWIVDKTDSSITFIVHPNFKDEEKFMGIIKKAIERSREQIDSSGMTKSFGLPVQEESRFHFFLVEEGDFFRLMGAEPLSDKISPWWVEDFGKGMRVYYTKARENLDTITINAQNFTHENVHKYQQAILNPEVFNRLHREWILMEGMPNWWNEIFVRPRYSEKDFLSFYLLNQGSFFENFLPSNQLINTGYNSSRPIYQWTAILNAMIYQRIGMQSKAGKKEVIQDIPKDRPNLKAIRDGLSFVSKNLKAANELPSTNGLLTRELLETIFHKEFGIPLGFDQILADYDRSGWQYGYNLISSQALTTEEREVLKHQKGKFEAKSSPKISEVVGAD